MGYQLKQSSATQPLLFWLVSSTDHITGLTGKAGSVVVKVSKNGATGVTPAGAITEVDSANLPGLYAVAASATDTSALGPLALHAKDAASDPYDDVFEVTFNDPVAIPAANVTQFSGTNAATPNVAGVPIVDVGYIVGTVATQFDGTAQAGAATTITLSSSDTAAAGDVTNRKITIVGGTGIGQSRYISAYNTSTRVATVPTWTTNPDSTSQYQLGDTADAVVLAYGTGQDPATLVLDVAASSHNTANTIGAKINSAASAGDPWSTALPGSYTSGQAGNIVGNNLNAAITSRLASGNVTVGAYAAGQDPATLVLDVAQSGHNTAGTIGAKIGTAGGYTFPANFATFSIDASGRIDVGKVLGTASAGAAGYVGIDWAHVNAPTTAVGLSGTTISTTQAVASVAGAVTLTSGERTTLAGVVMNQCSIADAVATAASAGSFTGSGALSSTDNFYQGLMLAFEAGSTNAGVARKITSYTGASRTFTFSGSAGAVDAPFPSTPVATDPFRVLGHG
jgi:hypothetical protein